MKSRLWGTLAFAVAVALTCVEASAAGPPDSFVRLATGGGGVPLGLYVSREKPAYRPTPAPPVVFLHGICGEPKNGCSVFSGLADHELVCARADLACPNGGAMWSGGTGALSRIESAVTRAAETTPGHIDPTKPRALVGFSQGAYVALRAAAAAPHRYPSLLLIGAFVKPTRAELERIGVKRIAFAAGDLDGSAATMRESSARLVREGFDARYVSLGKVGHTYIAEDPQVLADTVAWTASAAETD